MPQTPQQHTQKTKKALVLGCGGVVGGAWTTAMLAAYCDVTQENLYDFDVIMGTSSGAVLAALLGGGVSVDALVAAQKQPTVSLGNGTWQHGGALPSLSSVRQMVSQGLRFPALAMLKQAKQADLPTMAKLSALLPNGNTSLDDMVAMLSAAETHQVSNQTWVTHPNTWVVGLHTQTGQRAAFGRNDAPVTDIASAVRASYAVPGWCPYVNIGGALYMDGGAYSPTSADLLLPNKSDSLTEQSALKDIEFDEVVIIAPMTFSQQTQVTPAISHVKNPVGKVLLKLERQMRQQMTQQLNQEVALLTAAGKRVIRIEPTEADLTAFGYNMMDPARRLHAFHTAQSHAVETVMHALAP